MRSARSARMRSYVFEFACPSGGPVLVAVCARSRRLSCGRWLFAVHKPRDGCPRLPNPRSYLLLRLPNDKPPPKSAGKTKISPRKTERQIERTFPRKLLLIFSREIPSKFILTLSLGCFAPRFVVMQRLRRACAASRLALAPWALPPQRLIVAASFPAAPQCAPSREGHPP